MIDWAAQRRITAEHEAAHAICYLSFGYPIHRIEIEPDAITQSTPEPTMRPVQQLAIIAMAGPVVESRHRARFDLDAEVAEAVDWIESGDDPDELGDWELFGRFPRLARSAFESATAIVEHYRDDHDRLTAALLSSNGHLTGEDVAALDLAVSRR